jgi:hypothetical protein
MLGRLVLLAGRAAGSLAALLALDVRVGSVAVISAKNEESRSVEDGM